MSKQTLYCIASTRAVADQILHQFKERGHSNSAISVLFLDQQVTRRDAFQEEALAPDEDAGLSGEIRGVVAWIAGVRAIAMPGANLRLIAAGPICATFESSEAADLLGVIEDFGVPRVEALRYEQAIGAGGMLIGVHAENSDAIAAGRSIIREAGGQDLITMMHVMAPSRSGFLGRRLSRIG